MTYSEIFETNDGYEVLTWRTKADSEDDSGAKAIDRYDACDRCVLAAGQLQDVADIGRAEYQTVWVDENGVTRERVYRVCGACLGVGSPSGRGYVEVEPEPARLCEGCGRVLDPREAQRVVYCGRCGDPR